MILLKTDPSALLVFGIDASTGNLTLEQTFLDGVNGVGGLDSAANFGVACSPDGHSVYTASEDDDAIVHFEVGAKDGALVLSEQLRAGIGGALGLSGPLAMAMSPEGRQVYAVGEDDSALVVFNRDLYDGSLIWRQTIYDDDGAEGLRSARYVAVSPDGKHIYVSSTFEGFSVFNGTMDGLLRFVQFAQLSTIIPPPHCTCLFAPAPDGKTCM